jgi:hypothetical protein
VIDFRYHVVSIVAIFLALTVGLVIGASILSGSLANSLRNDLNKANNQITGQQKQLKSLQTQIDQQNKYISESAGVLVSGRLSGQCVALVQLPGDDPGAYASVRTMVTKQSGAMLCSDTTIEPALLTPSSQTQISALLKQHTPTGQKLTGTVEQQAVELIAQALTTYQVVGSTAETPTGTAGPKPTGSAGAAAGAGAGAKAGSGGATASPTATATATMTSSGALATLEDFQNAGMITMSSPPMSGEQATLAYVQAPTTVQAADGSGANADADNAVYLAFAEALNHGGAGTVVGGSGESAAKGGLVYAVVNDATATREIGTVDDTDVTMGQVASVFSLFDQSQGTATVAGHYGTGADNDGPIPPITSGLS